jgi:hypothetical protein
VLINADLVLLFIGKPANDRARSFSKNPPMETRIAALLLSCVVTATPLPSSGQEAEDLAASEMSREEWSRRVDEARRRSEEFVANARIQAGPPLRDNDLEVEAVERAMRDPTLQPGDLVATRNGLAVFVGRDERREANEFILAPGVKSRPH